MNPKPEKGSVAAKREQFRREVRSEYLHSYMKNVRAKMQGDQQCKNYMRMVNLINSMFEKEFKKSSERQKLEKISELVFLTNEGQNGAAVAIADLLLNEIITVEMIQSLKPSKNENEQNSENNEQCPDVMKIINFPDYKQYNEGWLALIRVLLKENYCTQDMIAYSLNTIAKNKNLQSAQFALEVIFILIFDKKVIKIQNLLQIIAPNISTFSKNTLNQIQKSQSLLIQTLINSLINFSLSPTGLQIAKNLRFYATKVLSKCFSNQYVLKNYLLPNLSLKKIAQFFHSKFSAKSLWDKKKVIKMINDLLDFLNTFQHYQPKEIIEQTILFIEIVCKETEKNCLQIYNKRTGQLGHSNVFSENPTDDKHEKFLVHLIQQSVYMIEILVEKYLFTHSFLSTTNQVLEKISFQKILDNIYLAFSFETNQMGHCNQNNTEIQMLTDQEQAKIWIVQNSISIAISFEKRLIEAWKSVKKNNLSLNQNESQKFLTLSELILSRLQQSQMMIRVYQERGEKQYEI